MMSQATESQNALTVVRSANTVKGTRGLVSQPRAPLLVHSSLEKQVYISSQEQQWKRFKTTDACAIYIPLLTTFEIPSLFEQHLRILVLRSLCPLSHCPVHPIWSLTDLIAPECHRITIHWSYATVEHTSNQITSRPSHSPCSKRGPI